MNCSCPCKFVCKLRLHRQPNYWNILYFRSLAFQLKYGIPFYNEPSISYQESLSYTPPEQTSRSILAHKQLIKEKAVAPRDGAEESSPTNSYLGLLLHLTPIHGEEVRNVKTSPWWLSPSSHHKSETVTPESSLHFSAPTRTWGNARGNPDKMRW